MYHRIDNPRQSEPLRDRRNATLAADSNILRAVSGSFSPLGRIRLDPHSRGSLAAVHGMHVVGEGGYRDNRPILRESVL